MGQVLSSADETSVLFDLLSHDEFESQVFSYCLPYQFVWDTRCSSLYAPLGDAGVNTQPSQRARGHECNECILIRVKSNVAYTYATQNIAATSVMPLLSG